MLPTHVSWENWTEMFLDASIWEPPVREVLSELGFSVRSIEAGFPGTSAVFKVRCGAEPPDGTTLIVKFYPPMARRDFTAEECVYRALSPESPLPIPKLVSAGILRDAIDWPYLVLEKSPGTAVRELRDNLTPQDLCDIGEEVGTYLRALHRTERTLVPALNRSVDRWKAWALSRLDQAPQELARVSEPGGVPYLGASVLEELRAFLRETGPRVIASMAESDLALIHGDVTEDHVLLTPARPGEARRFRVATIFDFGDAEVAPLYYEWIPVWFSLLRQDRKAFAALLRGYAGDTQGHDGPHGDTGGIADIDDTGAVGETARVGGIAGRSRSTVLVFTFIHRFSAAIIREKLSRENMSPGWIGSFSDLADILWPL